MKIQNLSYSATTGIVTVNFVLRNETAVAVEAVEAVEVQFDGEPAKSVFSIDFAKAGIDSKTCNDWTMKPGATSNVIELPLKRRIAVGSDDRSYWALDAPCDVEQLSILRDILSYPLVFNTGPFTTSTLNLRLRGLLADGAPWSAKARGELRE